MKGVILSRSPSVQIVDITHEIAPQAILSGAYVLSGACNQFPVGTIHLAVVDPGVGSNRRGIILRTERYFFVGPDNGLFSLVAAESGGAFEIKQSSYLPRAISNTFHGRDVFAPVAAALSSGVRPDELGVPIDGIHRLPNLTEVGEPEIQSRLLHIDRFGNCVTGIQRRHLASGNLPENFTFRIGETLIRTQRRFYSEQPIVSHEPFLIWGSLDFLEISLSNGSAAQWLNASLGQAVILSLR